MGSGVSTAVEEVEDEFEDWAESVDKDWHEAIAQMEKSFNEGEREFELWWKELEQEAELTSHIIEQSFHEFLHALVKMSDEIGLTNAAGFTVATTLLGNSMRMSYSIPDFLHVREKENELAKATEQLRLPKKSQAVSDEIKKKADKRAETKKKLLSKNPDLAETKKFYDAMVTYARQLFTAVVKALSKKSLSLIYGGPESRPNAAKDVSLSESFNVKSAGTVLFGLEITFTIQMQQWIEDLIKKSTGVDVAPPKEAPKMVTVRGTIVG